MNPQYREIHRAEISRLTRSCYNRIGEGVYAAPLLAGIACGLASPWPLALVCSLLIVGYATRKTIEQQKKRGGWARLVVGWAQNILFFASGFIPTVLLISGHRGLYVAFVPILFILTIDCYNRKKYLRAFYFNVAREYLKEIGKWREENSPNAAVEMNASQVSFAPITLIVNHQGHHDETGGTSICIDSLFFHNGVFSHYYRPCFLEWLENSCSDINTV